MTVGLRCDGCSHQCRNLARWLQERGADTLMLIRAAAFNNLFIVGIVLQDAWGIGALFYSTIAGQPPFKGANHKEVAAKIMDQQPGTLLKFPERMSPAARDFVLRCMRPNPLDRPTVLEMLSHPLLAMYAVPSRPNSGAISQTLPPVLEPCPEQMPAPGEQTAMPPPAAEAAC